MEALLQHRYSVFIRYMFRQFIDNRGVLNASALTYTTLFAVVPLMTVTYAMLAAIPSFNGVGDSLQAWVFSNFVPSTGAVVQDYLSDFSGQARQLTGVGITVLAITAIMMMKSIEAAFNRVWRVSEARKGLASFLLYWAVLSLGPILIGLGLVLSSYITSLSLVSSASELVGKGRLLSLVPLLLSAAAFTLLLMAVPNCRVPFKNALWGGILVAVLFELAKRSFTLFVTQFPSYELIYGAFAAFPLFLLWIFISWIIVLLGAEFTRALTIFRQGYNVSEPHLHTVCALLHCLWQAQSVGKAVSLPRLLSDVQGLNQSRWESYQTLLIDGGLITRSDQGGYLLCRNLDTLSLYELNQLLPWPLPSMNESAGAPWQSLLSERLASLNQSQQQTLGLSLAELFSEEGAFNT